MPTPDTPNSFKVSYAGEESDCTGLNEGDAFFWTLDLTSEHSCLFSGLWLVDFPDGFVTPESANSTWSGGLVAAINATWDDEEPWSDKAQVFWNTDYEGMTGQVPYGIAGNRYTIVGLFLNSFEYGGVQMSGSIIRIKFRVNRLPGVADMQHDSSGYYLPVPVSVVESYAMTEDDAVIHGSITVKPGKLYFRR